MKHSAITHDCKIKFVGVGQFGGSVSDDQNNYIKHILNTFQEIKKIGFPELCVIFIILAVWAIPLIQKLLIAIMGTKNVNKRTHDFENKVVEELD